MDPRVERIIEFLNDQHIRATYTAVGDAIEVPARSVATLLGGRTPRASWVVNAKDGEVIAPDAVWNGLFTFLKPELFKPAGAGTQ